MFANLGPPEPSGRPPSALSWVPGAVYAAAFALSLIITLAIAVNSQFHRRVKSFDDLGMEGVGWYLLGVEPFLICLLLPLVSRRWLAHVVRMRTPLWHILGAGVASGCLAGAGYLSLAFVDNLGWQ